MIGLIINFSLFLDLDGITVSSEDLYEDQQKFLGYSKVIFDSSQKSKLSVFPKSIVRYVITKIKVLGLSQVWF